LNAGRPSRQELLRFADKLAILLLGDATDARRRTALDLEQQAGTRAVLKIAVGTTS